jgi:hypothetical protein
MKFFFLAQPTWTCDIAEAVKGETAVLFLTPYVGGKDMFGRLPTRKELGQAGITKPMFLISDSGRGRMPLRAIRGEKYATLWVGDVKLPTSVPTISGPEPQSRFIRSASLKTIEDLIVGSTGGEELLTTNNAASDAQ